MKFIAEPNLYVRFTERHRRMFGKRGFMFNEKGFFETEHPLLIRVLSQKFQCAEETATEPENNADNSGETIKLKHCKKCDFTCENMGDLLAHYRAFHKGDK